MTGGQNTINVKKYFFFDYNNVKNTRGSFDKRSFIFLGTAEAKAQGLYCCQQVTIESVTSTGEHSK